MEVCDYLTKGNRLSARQSVATFVWSWPIQPVVTSTWCDLSRAMNTNNDGHASPPIVISCGEENHIKVTRNSAVTMVSFARVSEIIAMNGLQQCTIYLSHFVLWHRNLHTSPTKSAKIVVEWLDSIFRPWSYKFIIQKLNIFFKCTWWTFRWAGAYLESFACVLTLHFPIWYTFLK